MRCRFDEKIDVFRYNFITNMARGLFVIFSFGIILWEIISREKPYEFSKYGNVKDFCEAGKYDCKL